MTARDERLPSPRRLIRPWALAAPVVVLLVALPLLVPLRRPDPRQISEDEQSRLATVQALVENSTLAIEGTSFRSTRQRIEVGEHLYSDQPPVMSVLLSGPYWVMHRAGFTFERHGTWVRYALTAIGVTFPVALAAAFLYKLAKIFELKRPQRAGLAIAAVLGSGLISYATVLNPHAPAASFILGAVTFIFLASTTPSRPCALAWLAGAGAAAALAAVVDPPAVIFLILLAPAPIAFRARFGMRVLGVMAYLIAATAPVMLHLGLNARVTGDILPGYLHAELKPVPPFAVHLDGAPASASADDPDDDEPRTVWQSFGAGVGRIAAALLGRHGVLSHFPVLVFGALGVAMVLHRHWPATTKVLALTTVAGAVTLTLCFTFLRLDWHEAMFATRWFIPFLPLLLFWAGAWLRRGHKPVVWALASLLLAFSMTVSLLGATGPVPPGGFDRYTAAGAFANLINPPPPTAASPVLAGQWEPTDPGFPPTHIRGN